MYRKRLKEDRYIYIQEKRELYSYQLQTKINFRGVKYSILPLITEKNASALENPYKHIQITKEQSF